MSRSEHQSLLSLRNRSSRFALVLFGAVHFLGCDKKSEDPAADARDPRTGLTALEAQEVLVKVGDHKITLGQYAETLLRMDPYERLRYQTEERQKELLTEMVQVELLAQEARRRGLDKDPKVQLSIKQALRDELLADIERNVPPPESFSEREVRDYYEAHRSEFKEPLRHRVSVIEVKDKPLAEKIVAELLAAKSEEKGQIWAKLAEKHSLNRKLLGPSEAPELAGDLGFVSAPKSDRGENPAVPEKVRAAVFTLKDVGQIVEEPIEQEGKFYVVRLSGISPARDRSVAEAERTIRVELRRQKVIEAEEKFEKELREKYPVVISENAVPREPDHD